MSRQDQITGRKSLFGNNRSKALNATRKVFKLNLQKITILDNGRRKTVRASVKTIRTLRKKGLII